MGDLFGRPQAEYNIVMDPQAAQIVFGSGLLMRVIPFDITEHCLRERDLMDLLAEDERPLQRLIGSRSATGKRKAGDSCRCCTIPWPWAAWLPRSFSRSSRVA